MTKLCSFCVWSFFFYLLLWKNQKHCFWYSKLKCVSRLNQFSHHEHTETFHCKTTPRLHGKVRSWLIVGCYWPSFKIYCKKPQHQPTISSLKVSHDDSAYPLQILSVFYNDASHNPCTVLCTCWLVLLVWLKSADALLGRKRSPLLQVCRDNVVWHALCTPGPRKTSLRDRGAIRAINLSLSCVIAN